MGFPLDRHTFGGGFLYGMKGNQLIVGLVAGLDYQDPMFDPHTAFQRFKTHPTIKRLLDGGSMAFYGAKAIPEGGWWAMPRNTGDGFLVIGDSGGFLNGQRLKGIHLAMKSGMLAAETLFAGLVEDDLGPGRLATFEQRVEESWIHEELWEVRNFHQAFDHGVLAGVFQAAIGMLTRGRGWGLFNRLHTRAGHQRMKPLGPESNPETPFVPDGKLTFDKLADVYNSGTAHEEDQPVHLLVHDTDVCLFQCAEEFGNPCQRFCPASVYEMVTDEASPTGKRLQINASNCVHCKACDIMDPYQIITWVPPEGGGGPNYSRM
jgi:electron-transferring-flavoprotein dehydrogenase